LNLAPDPPVEKQWSRVAHLGAFHDLLQHEEKRGFVVLDLDDTIITNAYQPCCLMTEAGARMVQTALTSSPLCTSWPTSKKQHHINRLQRALQTKRLVESDTAQVIQQLQQAGCWVFGLTSRYSELASSTSDTLRSLGVDLAATAPFPPAGREAGRMLRDPYTGAVCQDGIIFTNALDKGLVLNRFLEHVVFRALLEEISQYNQATAKGAACELTPPNLSDVPLELVFVDDRSSNVRSVASGLNTAKQLGISVTSYLYANADIVPHIEDSPNSEVDEDEDNNPLASVVPGPNFDQSLARIQLRHFFEEHEKFGGSPLMTDQEARQFLSNSGA